VPHSQRRPRSGRCQGRSPHESRFGAALEPFTFIRLDFYEKENRELVTISQAEILKSNFELATHPDSTDALAYIAELVSEFAPPHEANDKLYRMVKACIDALASSPTDLRCRAVFRSVAAAARRLVSGPARLRGMQPALRRR